MTISNDDELQRLKEIGRVVADVLQAMGRALEHGMTTAELDRIGRDHLEQAGARPAPELAYGFPGATCAGMVVARWAQACDRFHPAGRSPVSAGPLGI